MPSESEHQIAFVKWFRYYYPDKIIFHIPNGGSRHVIEAKRLKEMGVLKGIPDLYIPHLNLFIEMKREKGKLDDAQIKCIAKLSHLPHQFCFVGYGFKDAKTKFLKFIKDTRGETNHD